MPIALVPSNSISNQMGAKETYSYEYHKEKTTLYISHIYARCPINLETIT
jgi:hypothetical protein